MSWRNALCPVDAKVVSDPASVFPALCWLVPCCVSHMQFVNQATVFLWLEPPDGPSTCPSPSYPLPLHQGHCVCVLSSALCSNFLSSIASSALPRLWESPCLCVFSILFGVPLFPDLSSEGIHVAWSIPGYRNSVDLLSIRITSGCSGRLDDTLSLAASSGVDSRVSKMKHERPWGSWSRTDLSPRCHTSCSQSLGRALR